MDASKTPLFHQYWWLQAATAGRFSEVEVKRGDYLAGRLPFLMTRRNGFRILGMPHFTHLLGPLVDAGEGKPQTRMMNRLSTVEALIDRLPSFDSIKLVTDPLADDGLAVVDGLAFQRRGFHVGYQYTFHLDCRIGLEVLLARAKSSVRQNIRRAEERCTIVTIDDPERFVSFYTENLKKRKRKSYMPFGQFPDLFSKSRARNCGIIFAAMQPGGIPTAMAFMVWDSERLYYLMTSRAPDACDNGSVSLLIWSAMKHAHELGLVFDLDGVTTAGTARFLSGFGGIPRTRLIITAHRPLYSVVQSVKTILRGGRSAQSTFT